jgi:3-mercaptopyruvate sulfurtransferase SseA
MSPLLNTPRRSRLLPLSARPAATLLALVLGAALGPAAHAQQSLDAAQARQALARGAVAWDLRSSGPVLPGAVRIAPQALQAWLHHGDTAALSKAVSSAGLNLSKEVVLVATDDSQAQAVIERLRPLARGRLSWLAGGTTTWQAAGLPLQPAPSVRLPMPQHLVPAVPQGLLVSTTALLADASRRATVTLSMGDVTTAGAPVPWFQP